MSIEQSGTSIHETPNNMHTILLQGERSYDDKVMVIEQSKALQGTVSVAGAKNAVLVSIAALLLADGVSTLENVPYSSDVIQMVHVLTELGVVVTCDIEQKKLTVDTRSIKNCAVSTALMKKMRASVLVMGPLLARFGKAEIGLPGGCTIGARPIDYHLKAFAKMNAIIAIEDGLVRAHALQRLSPARIVFQYPSVGATENVLMAAAATPGITTIINAAIEPEVLCLIELLKKMGADIQLLAPATIRIVGVTHLQPIHHAIMPDRLEAGTLLLAAAATGGSITLLNAVWHDMDVFLDVLDCMGHTVSLNPSGIGITLTATKNPRAVGTIKTSPYPGYPTDLQAQLMAALTVADGESIIHETVFENRLLHVRELQKMGAHISIDGNKAIIKGIDKLYGASVIATDIRASAALVIAGLIAQGTTTLSGLHHWNRGYDNLEQKLINLGGNLRIMSGI